MAAPTFTSITPSSGWSAGRQLVEIRGTNFRLPTTQPVSTSGAAPRAPQSVRVLFGGVPARSVRVYSSTLLRVLTPQHWATRWWFDFGDKRVRAPGPQAPPPPGATLVEESGTVDVTIENIDDDGDLIAGETITAPSAYSFVRPRLDQQGTWDRAVTAFVDALRVSIMDNVVDDADADYDVDTGEVRGLTSVSSLPAIALVNKNFDDSADQFSQGPDEEDGSGDYVLVRRAPIFTDFTCSLIGMSEDPLELRAMAELVRLFFQNQDEILIPKNPDVPAAGNYRLNLRRGPDETGTRESGRIGRTNLLIFTVQVLISGIPTESAPGIAAGGLSFMPDGSSHEGVVGVTRTAQSFPRTAVKKTAADP